MEENRTHEGKLIRPAIYARVSSEQQTQQSTIESRCRPCAVQRRSHTSSAIAPSADNLYFTGEVGTPLSTGGRLLMDAGSGLDHVEIEDVSAVHGQMRVNIAADNDIFYLSDLAYLVSGSINGGSGTDGYYGTQPRLNVIDMLFEVFGASPP